MSTDNYQACASCGSVVDLFILHANSMSDVGMNDMYKVDTKYFWQCRSCHVRNEVMNENILGIIKASAERIDETDNGG